MFGELGPELANIMLGREILDDHHIKQRPEPVVAELHPAQYQRLFLALVLHRGLRVQMLHAVEHERLVLFEELREVKVFPRVVGLLVEIHRADPDLDLLDIRRHVHHEVAGAHIPEKPHETPLVEFDELFGEPDDFHLGVVQPVLDEEIPGNTGHVLLDERVSAGQVVHAVGREQVLELQPVNPRGIRPLDVKVILVVVVGIDDPDPERLGVSERTIVHAIDVKVVERRTVATAFQQGVNVFQRLENPRHLERPVSDRLPQGVVPGLVQQRATDMEVK